MSPGYQVSRGIFFKLEQVLMLGKALDNWHYHIRAYTQLPHSALGFTLHLRTSNKPSSLPFWELMILHQSLANIVPSHLSHSLVCVALSIDNVMGFILVLILLSVVDLEDRGFVLSNKRKYQLDDLTRWFMYHVR